MIVGIVAILTNQTKLWTRACFTSFTAGLAGGCTCLKIASHRTLSAFVNFSLDCALKAILLWTGGTGRVMEEITLNTLITGGIVGTSLTIINTFLALKSTHKVHSTLAGQTH